jgi:DNA polymerase-3 subunit beta
MFTATIKYTEIQKFLSIDSQISPKKSELEIITYTKVDILEKTLKFESSNLSYSASGIIQKEGIENSSSVSFLIKTDLLFDCISSFSGEMVDFIVDIETHQLTIKVNQSKAKLRINTDLVGDWRQLSKADESMSKAKIKLLGSDFNQAAKLAQISVGQPKVVLQPEFLNICFTVKPDSNQLSIVSSDRFRLSINNTALEYLNNGVTNLEEATNFLLSTKVIGLVSRVLPDTSTLEIDLNTDDAWFIFDNIEIYTKFIDGKYPDYEKIVPQSFSCSLQVDKDELQKAIKQVFFLSRNQFNKDITFLVNPAAKQITITSKSDVLGESENQISILEIEGDESEWQQSFNATYFLDYLTLVNDKILTWDANPGKPSVLYAKDSKDKGLYLVCGLNR